jgi:hypothetical protein
MGQIIRTTDRAATCHWHNRWTPKQAAGWCAYFESNKRGQWARDEAERKKAEAAAAKADRDAKGEGHG